MNATEALGHIERSEVPALRTREVATLLGVSTPRASQLLSSLEREGLVVRLRNGLWCIDREVDPMALAPYLTAPYPAYISLWSGLAHHGMIEQIPRRVFVASLDRSRQVKTALGVYSVHHLAPSVFGGFALVDGLVNIATPEKSLFDTVYVRAPRGGRAHFPELEIPRQFSQRRLNHWASQISSSRLRTLVQRGIEEALASSS